MPEEFTTMRVRRSDQNRLPLDSRGEPYADALTKALDRLEKYSDIIEWLQNNPEMETKVREMMGAQ